MSKPPETIFARLRGTRYRDQRGQIHALMLTPGDPCLLEREPHNPADGNAIKVLCPNCETHMGYVDKVSAAQVACHIDNGWVYLCTVKSSHSVLNLSGIRCMVDLRLDLIKGVEAEAEEETGELVPDRGTADVLQES